MTYKGPESGRALWESVNKKTPGGIESINKKKTVTKPKKVVKPKSSAFSKKKDLIGDALKDRSRRYTPYKRIDSAFSS